MEKLYTFIELEPSVRDELWEMFEQTIPEQEHIQWIINTTPKQSIKNWVRLATKGQNL